MRENLIEELRNESRAYPHDTFTRKLLIEAAAALEALLHEREAEALREIQNNAARPTPTPRRGPSR